MKLPTELESYLKIYLKRKYSSKTVTQQHNKQKIRTRKGIPEVMPQKELPAIRINYLIKIQCGGWKVPLVYTLSHPYEKEVSSVLNYTCKIRPPKGIRNDQLAYYNFYWMAYANILFPFISNV